MLDPRSAKTAQAYQLSKPDAMVAVNMVAVNMVAVTWLL